MKDKQRTRASKFLSKHLRHDPAGLGLTLEPDGWVPVDALLVGWRRAGIPRPRNELAEIVTGTDKQRFAFDETGNRIRANQGHSVGLDLDLEPAESPAVLYRGTDAVPAVLRQGLRKMCRHHVHLSPEVETATRVAAWHGRPVVLAVDAAAMTRAGHVFRVSANRVWLTDEVPPAFLRPTEGPTA